MEQIFDWLNENENRAYPLLDSYNNKTYLINEKSWKFPDDLLIDLQLVIHNFLLKNETIYLKKIILNNSNIEIVFTATDQSKVVAIFNVNFNELNQLHIYKRNSDGCLAVFGKGLNKVKDACEGITQTLDLDLPVEFATCYEFRNAWLGVKQITVSPEKLTDTNYINPKLIEAVGLQNVSNNTILTGDVKFLEGYNFRVIIRNNLIDLEISKGNGLNTNCSTHFIPDQYIDCDDIVSYINGVPPDENGNFRITQGDNIVLTSGKSIANFNDSYAELANQHTLFVSMVFSADNLCSPISPTVL